MKQPELGRKLANLRKEKNITQEELVEKCNVSVRTIQRIEAGEVTPRVSTVKIILSALEEDFESIIKTQNTMSHKSNWIMNLFVVSPDIQQPTEENKLTLLTAAIGGIVYLVLELIKSAFDMAWFSDELGPNGSILYTIVIVALFVSYFFFMRGFILFGHLFGNALLRISAYMLIFAMIGLSFLDVYTFHFYANEKATWELLLIPYGTAAVIFGALGIVLGVSLIKLQDGMGDLSRITGIMEIVMGCLLITVVLFFIAFVVMIPTIILEIILLYRGYEYLVKSESTVSQGG